MQSVIAEVAEKEVGKWLDHKRVKESKRESLDDQVEAMIEGFMDGILVLNPDNSEITCTLAFPIGEGGIIKELKIRPRLKVGQVKSYLKGVKSGDGDGRVAAYVCAITGQTSGIIADIDTEDYSLLSAIAVFFF